MSFDFSEQEFLSSFAQESARFDAEAARRANVIGKKIRAARKKRGLTQGELACDLEQYGVHVKMSAVNKWESGETVPNAYQLAALCHALQIQEGYRYFFGEIRKEVTFPGLNTEGTKKLMSYRQDLIASGRYAISSPAGRMREMPYSVLPASAGEGDELGDEFFEMREFPEASIPSGADFALRVDGDSMEPVYIDGQSVWVQRCDTLSSGEVGLFMVDGLGYIKVYEERMPKKDLWEDYMDSYGVVHPQVVLISYNKHYAPRIITPQMRFRIAGRILG